MNIQQDENDTSGVFFIAGKNNDHVAELVYNTEHPSVIIIEHTEVSEELRGRDIGYLLVQAAVEYAREQQLKVVPVCSFAKAVMEEKTEFQDVL
jgi:predicted GNAT family acetyltransferase